MMEFAIVLPMLLVLFFGVVEFGRMLAIFSSLSSASKQAARYGSVAGDSNSDIDGEQPFYMDCQGMRETVRRTALFVGVGDENIAIRYERGTGAITETVAICATSALTPTSTITGPLSLRDGDRVIVGVSALYRPLVPLVPVPDIPLSFESARTIFTSIVGPTSTPRPNPDLRVFKSGSPNPVAPGGDVTYVITVTNASGSSAGQIILTDTLPPEITADQFISASGSDWSCSPPSGSPLQVVCERLQSLPVGISSQVVIRVEAPAVGGFTMFNNVTVTSARADYNPADNTAMAPVMVVGGADLVVNKTAALETVGSGTPLTYTLWTVNNGPEVADASTNDPIVMTDTLPLGVQLKTFTWDSDWTNCVSIANLIRCWRRTDLGIGAATGLVTIVITPTTAGTLSNMAQVAAPLTVDPLPNSNTAVVETTVTSDADLELFKSSSPTTVLGGETFIYLMRVTNRAGSLATNIQVHDPLPAGTELISAGGTNWSCAPSSGVGVTTTCTYAGSLLPGSVTPDLILSVKSFTGGTAVNTATVTADQPDLNPGNNSATATTSVVTCEPLLASAEDSVVTASPAQVQSDGLAYATVLVTLVNNCPAHDLVTSSQTVTLSSSRGGADTVTLDPAYPTNTTVTGQIAFRVASTSPGTSTYSATANGIPLNRTANVDYYSCVSGVPAPPPGNVWHQFVQYLFENNSGIPRRLVSISLSWPQNGSRKITSIALDAPTIWSGSSNRNPFELPSASPAEDWSGTSSERTLNMAQTGILKLNFNFDVHTNPPSNTFSLTTTWDDGSGGSPCTITTDAVR